MTQKGLNSLPGKLNIIGRLTGSDLLMSSVLKVNQWLTWLEQAEEEESEEEDD